MTHFTWFHSFSGWQTLPTVYLWSFFEFCCITSDLIDFHFKCIHSLREKDIFIYLFNASHVCLSVFLIFLCLLIFPAVAEVMNCAFLAQRHRLLFSSDLLSMFVLGFHASHVLIMLYLPCRKLWALSTPASALCPSAVIISSTCD